MIADSLVNVGKIKDAIKIYSYIFDRDPDVNIGKRLAQLYLWSEDLKGAIGVYERLLSRGFSGYEILSNLAQWYLWDERQMEAIKIYRMLVRDFPDSIKFHRILAKLYMWNEMTEEAIKEYEVIIELDPSDLKVIAELAQLYVWTDRQMDAIPLYRKLVRAFPDSLNYHWMLCQLLFWNGMVSEAKRELIRFLKKDPDHIQALEILIQLQYYSGEWDLAMRNARYLIRISPGNQLAEKILSEIKANYSPHTAVNYYWITDTNKLTKLRYYLESRFPINRFWEVKLDLERIELIDGRKVDGNVIGEAIGYGAMFSFRYNIPPLGEEVIVKNFSLEFTGGGIRYGGDGFIDVTFRINANIGDKIYPQFIYSRYENREGVRAVRDGIYIDNFQVTAYWQVFDRLGISWLISYGLYSDGNLKRTYGAYFNFMLVHKPRVTLAGFYSYEDFDSVYTNSLPYWTPDKLSTFWGEVGIEHKFFNFLTFGFSSAVAKNPGQFTSINYRGFAKFRVWRFEIYALYEKYGSAVYNYRSSRFYLRYTF
jgi:tetratricopeptide (TPR) repeat protein